ncbi:MAG: hypothetical protein KF846_01445 [Cyclobacteriaceae bacterium]|nr:hypothetical protein [Cyclobacteriaceae bacterium]
MKNKFLYPLIICLLITLSCEQEVIDLQDPDAPPAACNSCPAGASAGANVSFAKFVSIGNGFVAGFQAGALFTAGQNNSMAKLLSAQLNCASGSTAAFNQPDIGSVNGYNVQSSIPGVITLGRLILFDPDGPTGPRSATPYPSGFPGAAAVTCPSAVPATPALPAPYNTADLPTAFTGDKNALNNYGVPLIFLGQALTPATGNPGAGAIYNPLWARFAKEPGVKSMLEDALGAAGSFYLIWLGVEDALLNAATGASGAYPLTDPAAFNTQYTTMITTMLAANPTFKGVVGNIPSISSFPHFTTVTWNQLKLSAAQVEGLTPMATGYNSILNSLVPGTITAAERDKRLLTYTVHNPSTSTDIATRSAVLIVDEDLTDLSSHLPASLAHLAKARQAKSNDLIPLAAGSILGTCFSGLATAVYGVSFPIPDQYALTNAEIVVIETALAQYNATISTAVANSNNRLALADVKAAYANLLAASANPATRGILIDGVTVASSFAPPAGIFSEDGLHPNNRGNAFTANIFIDAINAKFTSTVPKICMTQFGGTSLPVNP